MNFKIGLFTLALLGCLMEPLKAIDPKPNANTHSFSSWNNDDMTLLAMNMSDLLNDFSGLTEDEYRERIQSLSNEIEFRIDPLIKERIELRLSKAKVHTEIMLGKAEIYFPIFEEYLEKYEIPHLLKYLAIIESALEPRARSHAGAGGLWQFMPSTGRMYKMEISSTVDERSDTYKATEAAAELLAKLKEYHGDWCLALASYNCGAGRVNKAIKSAGTTNYWEVRRFLPVETQKYVPFFMAMVYVGEYAHLHDINPVSASKHLVQTDTIHYSGSTTLAQLAKEVGVDVDTVRFLNPSYLKNYVPKRSEGSIIVLPASAVAKMRGYEAQLEHLNNIQQENPIRAIRRIFSNDDIERFARAFRCTVKDIFMWNNLPENYQVKAGDLIAIRKFNVNKDAANNFFARRSTSISVKDALVIPALQVIALSDDKAITMTSRDLAKIAAYNPEVAGAITQTSAVYATSKNAAHNNHGQVGEISASRERSRNLRNETTATPELPNIPTATVAAANAYVNSAPSTTNSGLASVNSTTNTIAPKANTNNNTSKPIGSSTQTTVASNNSNTSKAITNTVSTTNNTIAATNNASKPIGSNSPTNNTALAPTAPVQAISANTTTANPSTVIVPKAVQQQTTIVSANTAVAPATQSTTTDLQRSRARNLRQDYSQETPATILGEQDNNPQVAAQKMDPQNQNFHFHCVEPNETIWDIVKKYPNVSSKELMETNKLSRNTDIYPGLILKVPVR